MQNILVSKYWRLFWDRGSHSVFFFCCCLAWFGCLFGLGFVCVCVVWGFVGVQFLNDFFSETANSGSVGILTRTVRLM